MRVNEIVIFALLVIVSSPVFAYDWATNPGDGSVDSPFEISTPDQLMSIGSDPLLLDKHFVLVNDIVFDPENNPAHIFTDSLIAPDPYSDNLPVFSGHFDGAGFRIVNLKIISQTRNTGLFGIIHGSNSNQVAVRDLIFVNPVLYGPKRIGPLVGSVEECTIENCHTIGGSIGLSDSGWVGGLIGVGFYMVSTDCSASAAVSGDVYVGGLSGSNNSSTFIDCSASGDVRGNEFVGGLIGNNRQWIHPELNDRDEIVNCHATGNVYCLDESGGGLIGHVYSGLIQNCSATGMVTGGSKLGGLIGFIESERMNYYPPLSGPTTIKSCFAAGNVQGIGNYIGGLIGYSEAILINKSYALGNVSSADSSSAGSSSVGGLVGLVINSTISQCYVTSEQLTLNDPVCEKIGGLIGCIYGGKVENSYAICTFRNNTSASIQIGGLIGDSLSCNISFCYTIPTTSGNISVADIDGNSSSNPQHCSSSSSMTGWSKHPHWDYLGRDGDGENDIWRMCVDGVSRPYLSWEFARSGDFACDDGIGFSDLAALAENWLKNEAITPATFSFACDANGDGNIDLNDLYILSENW